MGGLIFSGVCLLLGVVLLVARRPPNSGEITARVVVVLLIGMLVADAFSGYGSAGPAEQSLKPKGLQILTIQETGSYTTTVIQGDSIRQVNDWLAANGFSPFAADQAKAAESYIAGKWVFLCVKLKAAAPGLA